MDSKRELELQFIIAASDGNTPELTRCLNAGVDIECRAPPEGTGMADACTVAAWGLGGGPRASSYGRFRL